MTGQVPTVITLEHEAVNVRRSSGIPGSQKKDARVTWNTCQDAYVHIRRPVINLPLVVISRRR